MKKIKDPALFEKIRKFLTEDMPVLRGTLGKMKAKCLFFDPSLINFINDDGNGVITGNVAGRAEGILSDVKGNHEGADRAVGVTQLFTKDHPKERQGRHDGAARSTRRSNHGNAEGHDERNNRAQMDRNLVHEADCRGTGCDGDHGTAHMDVGAKRNDEVTDLFADTVGLGAFRLTGMVAAEDWVPNAVV